jgi:hypothetical protein
MFFVLLPVLALLVVLISQSSDQQIDEVIAPIITTIIFLYSLFLFKRFFNEKWIPTIIKSLLFSFAYLWYLIPIYQWLIFEVTFALL